VITPFGLRHIGLLRDLQGASVLLDRKSALLEVPSTPLQAALRGYFLRSSRVFSYVLEAPADSAWRGFVQTQACRSGLAWRISCLAPALDSSEDAATIWYRLLLHLCIAAGERHVQRLFACLPQDSPAEEVFRQASFAVYSHERLFARTGSKLNGKQSDRIRVAHPEDRWGLQKLYHRATPRLVAQVEQPSDTQNGSIPFEVSGLDSQQGYVLCGQNGEIGGYLQVADGSRGSWLRLTVHPDLQEGPAEMLDHALALFNAGTTARVADELPRPLYCTVREYEGGIQPLLEERGFAVVDTCSLVVKHTTVQVREPQRKLVPALEKRAGVAPTVSHSESS